MTVLLSGSPTRGCRCDACRQVRTRLLDRLSPPQRACFDALDRVVPRHPQDVKDRAGVTANTIHSLVYPSRPSLALATRIVMRRFNTDPAMPFLLLTDLGRDVANPALRI